MDPFVFHGFELLLLKHFNENPTEWRKWRLKLQNIMEMSPFSEQSIDFNVFGDIPQNLSFALHKRPKFILKLVQEDLKREASSFCKLNSDSLLSLYLSGHQFTELHLDNIFKFAEDNTLPAEIFRCSEVSYLSLKFNSLKTIPCDIGRMEKLECLELTNNKLQVHSLPHALTFCKRLKSLYLDNNLLDALPGFLLLMSSLETVHRHGNHNYFKSTFMWYHTDVNYRIILVPGSCINTSPVTVSSLQFCAAKTIIGSKKNFYNDAGFAEVLKNNISEVYSQFHICHFCDAAVLKDRSGYKVITFKNPYLGNTCVPFQHWTCSMSCAKALEVPARIEQIVMAKDLDDFYEDYVAECHRDFEQNHGLSKLLTSLSTSSLGQRSKCEIL